MLLRDKKDLARLILDMSYGEMMEVARDLRAMVEAKPGGPGNFGPHDFADLLNEWAIDVNDDYEESKVIPHSNAAE